MDYSIDYPQIAFTKEINCSLMGKQLLQALQSMLPTTHWKKSDSNRFCKWLLENMDDRVRILLSYFDEELTEDHRDLLLRLGEKVALLLKNDARYHRYIPEDKEHPYPVISDHGFSLVLDMGLLMTKLLLDSNDSLRIMVVQRPKSDVDYNLPAIFHQNGVTRFNIITMSIGIAARILDGKYGANAWADTYEKWEQKFKRL